MISLASSVRFFTAHFGCTVFLALALAGHGAAMAQSGLEGAPLSVARAAVLKEGWQPLETYGAFPDGLRWNEDGDAGALYKAGFKEVEACSGTGANYCSFNYVRGAKCLALHTQGEYEAGKYEPVVIRRTHTCPKPDVLRPASAPKQPG